MTFGEYFDQQGWSWFEQMCFVKNLELLRGGSPSLQYLELDVWRRQKIPEKYVYDKSKHKLENGVLKVIDRFRK